MHYKFTDMVSRLFLKPDDRLGKIGHAMIGISTEAGELLDCYKKAWIYGKPLDEENIKEEIGDLLFYIEALCQTMRITEDECKRANFDKLSKRYPTGTYTDKDAIARADK